MSFEMRRISYSECRYAVWHKINTIFNHYWRPMEDAMEKQLQSSLLFRWPVTLTRKIQSSDLLFPVIFQILLLLIKEVDHHVFWTRSHASPSKQPSSRRGLRVFGVMFGLCALALINTNFVSSRHIALSEIRKLCKTVFDYPDWNQYWEDLFGAPKTYDTTELVTDPCFQASQPILDISLPSRAVQMMAILALTRMILVRNLLHTNIHHIRYFANIPPMQYRSRIIWCCCSLEVQHLP